MKSYKLNLIYTTLILVLSCKPTESDTKQFKNSSESTISLEGLSESVSQLLKNPNLCKQKASSIKQVLALGQSAPGMEGNVEATCSTQGDKVLCKQSGYTTTGLGFEFPKGGIDAAAQAYGTCYFLSRVLGFQGSKPKGYEDASFSIHKVSGQRSIRDFQESYTAYLFKINTKNKLDGTARTTDVYISDAGQVLGASFTENPGINYNEKGNVDQPYAEFQFVSAG